MARTRVALGNGARLTDFLSKRSFSATAAVYYCMALSLYPEAAYGDVFDAVAQGLAWRCRSQAPTSIKASSISVARARLSWPIFRRVIGKAGTFAAL